MITVNKLPSGMAISTSENRQTLGISLEFDTPEAADELIERVKAAKAVRPAGMPEEGQEVWILEANGEIRQGYWTNQSQTMLAIRENGQMFLAYELAEKDRERRKALQRVKAWIAENTEPFDWRKDCHRCYIVYESVADRFLIMKEGWALFPIVEGLPLMRESNARRLIESCESDLRILAGGGDGEVSNEAGRDRGRAINREKHF